MSSNHYVAISAWGFTAEREPLVIERIERILVRERLRDQFHEPGTLGTWYTPINDRLDGERMIASGSYQAVIVSGLSHEFGNRILHALRDEVAAADGPAAHAAISMRPADPGHDRGPDNELNVRVHAAEAVQPYLAEALRGGETKRLIERLCGYYLAMPSWTQRDIMLQILSDYTTLEDPALNLVWRKALLAPFEPAPAYRYYSIITALCGVSRTRDGSAFEALSDAALMETVRAYLGAVPG